MTHFMSDNNNYVSILNIIRPDEISNLFVYIFEKRNLSRIYVKNINQHAINDTFHRFKLYLSLRVEMHSKLQFHQLVVNKQL